MPKIATVNVDMTADSDSPEATGRAAVHVAADISVVAKLKEAILENAKAIYGPQNGIKDFGIISVREPRRVTNGVSAPLHADPDGTIFDDALGEALPPLGPDFENDAHLLPYSAKLLAYAPDGNAWAMLQSGSPHPTLPDALEGLLKMLQWKLADIL